MGPTPLASVLATFEHTAPVLCLPEPEQRRALRRAAGVSLPQAAALVGVSSSTLARWEAGQVEPRSEHEHDYRRALATFDAIAAEGR